MVSNRYAGRVADSTSGFGGTDEGEFDLPGANLEPIPKDMAKTPEIAKAALHHSFASAPTIVVWIIVPSNVAPAAKQIRMSPWNFSVRQFP
jgi:hypothetical protein